jgi:hypothetical protein
MHIHGGARRSIRIRQSALREIVIADIARST